MNIAWENPEVDIAALPRMEDVRFQMHPVRYKSYRILVASIFLSVLILTLSIIGIVNPGWWLIAAGALLIAFVALTFMRIHFGYKRRSYALREKDLTYKKGWIFYETTTIPFNRIQHTEISQGPIERRYELCSLKIYTAGGSSSDLIIPGLEQDEAQALRDFVAQKSALYA